MSEYIETSLFGKPFLSAIIVAAGNSSRMGGENKQFIDLDGKPVLAHTLSVFESCDIIDEIIVVTKQEMMDKVQDLCTRYGISKLKHIVVGGETRSVSVKNGVETVCDECQFIAIHDGARPLVRSEDIEKCAYDAFQCGGAVLAVPVTDTIKYGKKNGLVEYTPAREKLFAAQTPQIFNLEIYKTAMERAFKELSDWTDDSRIFENDSRKVFITEGSRENIKITSPEDIPVAEALLKRRNQK